MESTAVCKSYNETLKMTQLEPIQMEATCKKNCDQMAFSDTCSEK